MGSKRHLAPLAGWLFVPALGFGLGWVLRPAPPAPAGGGFVEVGPGEYRLVGSRGAPAERPADRVAEGAAPDADKRPGETVGLHPLGDAAFAELGRRWRATTDPVARRALFAKMLEGLTAENAERLRSMIAHLPPGSAEFRDFHFAWGQVAGADAVYFGVATEEPDMGPALAGWASADPAAAMEWFRKLDYANDPALEPILGDRAVPVEKLREHLARGLVDGLAANDPGLALAFAVELAASGDGATRGLVDQVAAKILANEGVEGAAHWAEALPGDLGAVPYRRPDGKIEPEGVRAAAMRRVAHDYAHSDPVAASQWVTANAELNRDPWVVREVAKEWAREDPASSVAWLESLGDSRGQREGLSAAYAHWASKDPLGASEYLVDLPGSTGKDFALNGFTAALAHKEPSSAVIWAAEIDNPVLREISLVRAGRRYYVQEPTEAALWLSGSDLPDAARQRVLDLEGPLR